MEDLKTIEDYVKKLNSVVEEIQSHPIVVNDEDIPSNMKIILSGVAGEKGMNFLFSTKLDKIIEGLLDKLESGSIESLLEDTEKVKLLINSLFGTGSFQGPVSQEIFNSLERATVSKKYNNIRLKIGKGLRKIKIIEKELNKGKKKFKNNSELLQKYEDSVYAIKQIIKIAIVVYKNRQLVNQRVLKGLDNIVHENEEIFESMKGMEWVE